MTIPDIKAYLPKIGLGIAGLVMGVLLITYTANSMASKKIHNAELVNAALLQKVDDLQKGKDAALKDAATYKAKVNALEPALAEAKRVIAGMKPQPPVHNPNDTPTAIVDLAAAFTTEGFPPIVDTDSLKWTAANARPMLPLIQDGKNYPLALERIGNLETQTGILAEQKDNLLKANASLQTAETACEGQVTALQRVHAEDGKIIDGQKTQIKVEKTKGWLKAGAGVALGWLLKVIVVAL